MSRHGYDNSPDQTFLLHRSSISSKSVSFTKSLLQLFYFCFQPYHYKFTFRNFQHSLDDVYSEKFLLKPKYVNIIAVAGKNYTFTFGTLDSAGFHSVFKSFFSYF